MSGRATVALDNAALVKNRSAGYGGAILVSGDSQLRVNDSVFADNSAHGDGGAIAFWYGKGDIQGSGFRANSTRLIQSGGAIYVGIGVDLSVRNSSFSGNSAGYGGALASEVWTPGGIIASRTTLRHVTLVDNGIFVDEADTGFDLYNSIIAGAVLGHCAGPLNESVGNLIEDGSCGAELSGEALLGERTGWPPWHPLLDGSPALDGGHPRYCLPIDQIGTPRPQGGGCDIGAIESTSAIPGANARPGDLHAARPDHRRQHRRPLPSLPGWRRRRYHRHGARLQAAAGAAQDHQRHHPGRRGFHHRRQSQFPHI